LIAGLSIEMRPEKAYIYHALEFMVAFQDFPSFISIQVSPLK